MKLYCTTHKDKMCFMNIKTKKEVPSLKKGELEIEIRDNSRNNGVWASLTIKKTELIKLLNEVKP